MVETVLVAVALGRIIKGLLDSPAKSNDTESTWPDVGDGPAYGYDSEPRPSEQQATLSEFGFNK